MLIRPFFSVVMGHVGDIGESVATDIPFERVSTTTYLNQRGIPIEIMEDVMAKFKRSKLELIHPNAAGIDIGSASHFVAVPPDRDNEPVREFKSFTADLNGLADWLEACEIDTVAMESTVTSRGTRGDRTWFFSTEIGVRVVSFVE